jgi:hypothetical protein
MTVQQVVARIKRNHGFLELEDLRVLAREKRLTPVLLRFGACRCTCPAQDAEHIIDALTAHGDYCRDISIPATPGTTF